MPRRLVDRQGAVKDGREWTFRGCAEPLWLTCRSVFSPQLVTPMRVDASSSRRMHGTPDGSACAPAPVTHPANRGAPPPPTCTVLLSPWLQLDAHDAGVRHDTTVRIELKDSTRWVLGLAKSARRLKLVNTFAAAGLQQLWETVLHVSPPRRVHIAIHIRSGLRLVVMLREVGVEVEVESYCNLTEEEIQLYWNSDMPKSHFPAIICDEEIDRFTMPGTEISETLGAKAISAFDLWNSPHIVRREYETLHNEPYAWRELGRRLQFDKSSAQRKPRRVYENKYRGADDQTPFTSVEALPMVTLRITRVKETKTDPVRGKHRSGWVVFDMENGCSGEMVTEHWVLSMVQVVGVIFLVEIVEKPCFVVVNFHIFN
ncbi:hypothetical protein EDD18DRAFT_1329558 [Armillaria luteobubalina]|uniref:Uncharacterized protein n=1 Tax=Armillaria luteobubalina TaxID=153913 RepID=A0AA39QFC1_9AGAR|nr:hypothetical protein EDD18DRAFT_1329558 [Armillaria luteobubalina]